MTNTNTTTTSTPAADPKVARLLAADARRVARRLAAEAKREAAKQAEFASEVPADALDAAIDELGDVLAAGGMNPVLTGKPKSPRAKKAAAKSVGQPPVVEPVAPKAKPMSARAKKAEAKLAAAIESAETHDDVVAAVAASAQPARKSRPSAERRNDMAHPDGVLAVEFGGCPKCSAKKGDPCFANDGKRTKYVHGPRFAAWVASTSS